MRTSLGRQGLEVAHLKAIGLRDLSFGVANLVSSLTEPELSLPEFATYVVFFPALVTLAYDASKAGVDAVTRQADVKSRLIDSYLGEALAANAIDALTGPPASTIHPETLSTTLEDSAP